MKILLAEDEKELSNVLLCCFHNNYVVDVVYDGEDAISYAQEIDYDIIILI